MDILSLFSNIFTIFGVKKHLIIFLGNNQALSTFVKEKRKQRKKHFCKAILPVLTARPQKLNQI